MRKINIVEVGPRDGFQNICDFISTETKLNVIDAIAKAGVKHIQVTSFVNPKAIPQMKDAKTVAEVCKERYSDIEISALTPNLRGVDDAVAAGITNLSYVISLSESHNKANVRKTRDESIAELEKVLKKYPSIHLTLDLATTFGCPFEGIYTTDQVVHFVDRLVSIGVKDINLCDTVGLANPQQVRNIVSQVISKYPQIKFQIHIHDTRGMGLVNTLAGIEAGIDYVQSTLGGLGGCPFAPGASGNTSTEDLVYMLNEMNFDTGIQFSRLLAAAKYEYKMIQGNYSGHHLHIEK
ncbi:MAG TPA: hydroxymethylglutaryl-CoA lyase [Clostridiaceae bacterium]|nr:hydroxymethylglutaryl-CoA lyase [Clostridiaceae bacterium]